MSIKWSKLIHPIKSGKEASKVLNQQVKRDAEKIVDQYKDPNQQPPQTNYSPFAKVLVPILLAIVIFAAITWLIATFNILTPVLVLTTVIIIVSLLAIFFLQGRNK